MKRTRRNSAEVAQAKRDAKIALAHVQVNHWRETLAKTNIGSQYREAWKLALQAAERRLAALEAE